MVCRSSSVSRSAGWRRHRVQYIIIHPWRGLSVSAVDGCWSDLRYGLVPRPACIVCWLIAHFQGILKPASMCMMSSSSSDYSAFHVADRSTREWCITRTIRTHIVDTRYLVWIIGRGRGCLAQRWTSSTSSAVRCANWVLFKNSL